MSNKILVSTILFVLVLGGGIYWLATYESGPGQYDGFAQCLKDKGVIFYGAFWCSHCQNQKALFGSSAKLLSYVECSTPDGRGQEQICKDQEIEGYPTWEYADGSRESGELALEHLAEKSGCALEGVAKEVE